MTKKTVLQWFNTIADETIRKQAIENAVECCGEEILNDTIKDLRLAIISSFVLRETPQGFDYWNYICEKARKGTLEIIDTQNTEA